MKAKSSRQRTRVVLLRIALRVSGGGLLIATAGIHLDLYLTGYRTIPTIGTLFLLQIIVASLLGAVLVVTGSRLVAAAGAGFLVSTLGGYLLTLWIGLFGFKEVRTTAGIVAGVIELVGFAVLAVIALGPAPDVAEGKAGRAARMQAMLAHSRPAPLFAIGALTVIVAVVFGTSLATSGPTNSTATVARLKAGRVGQAAVVADARGLTLYWFAPDTSSTSKCNGDCTAYWPPVIGRPVAAPPLTGRLGTIVRSGGATQASYDGHPLYTYVGDSGPGQANGNDLDLNGGLWHEVLATR